MAIANIEEDRAMSPAPLPEFAPEDRMAQVLLPYLRRVLAEGESLDQVVRDAGRDLICTDETLTDGPVTEPRSERRLLLAFHFWTMRSFQIAEWRNATDPDVVEAFPFLVFDSGLSNNRRHRRLNKLALPYNHPIWNADGPACLLNCKCITVPASKEDIRGQGARIPRKDFTMEQNPLGLSAAGGFPRVPFLLPDEWIVRDNFCSHDDYFSRR